MNVIINVICMDFIYTLHARGMDASCAIPEPVSATLYAYLLEWLHL